MKVTVGVSNRHVHLTRKTYEYLFSKSELEKRNDLNQIGEFASTETVDLIYRGKMLEHVRIVGPFRSHNQIELLGSDGEYLNIQLPTRRSDKLEDTPCIIISANGKTVTTDGVIRAERHVHVPLSRSSELGLHERDEVEITYPGGTFKANVKVSENGYFELHIDKDEAAEFDLHTNDEVELKLCGK